MTARWDTLSLVVGPPRPPFSSKGPRPPYGLDPYFRWAQHTQWSGFARLARWDLGAPQNCDLQIIAKADSKAALDTALADPMLGKGIPDIYRKPIPGSSWTALHFTARLTLAHQAWLLSNTLNLRWRLAMPLRDAQSAAEASPKGLFGPDRDQASMRADNVVKDAITTLRKKQSKTAKDGLPGADSASELDGAIALIDFGCPFLNQRFAIKNGTRIRALWDQGSDPGEPREGDAHDSWPWRAPAQFKYGRELGPEVLQAMVGAASTVGGPEESAVYRGIDYLIDYADPRRRVWLATHGGHLLDVAGGKVDPLSGRDDDAAASANLVFVQLPSLTAADSAGGSLSAHLLDGVRFALSTVAGGAPLVAAISYGNSAGPHDGSSLIESAFEELLKFRANNFAIVLAAGNSRNDRGHALRTVRRDRSILLRLMLTDGDTTDTFVETWYEGPYPLQLRVRAPDGVWSNWIGQDEEMLMRASSADRDVVAMIRHDRWVPNGKGALALLALAPTAQPPGVDCRLAEAGLWEIEFRLADNSQDSPVELNAWIERDDPVRGTEGGRTHFLDQTDEDEHNTISGIATSDSTLKAGGFNLGSDRAAAYSSLPRKGQAALTVLAACEEDLVQPNVLAAATRSSEAYRMNGTSVAAPVLARRLYNVMSMEGPFTGEELREVATLLALSGADPCIKPVAED